MKNVTLVLGPLVFAQLSWTTGGCCSHSSGGSVSSDDYRRSPALVETVTGCSPPQTTYGVSVYAAAVFNLLVDVWLDDAPEDAEEFESCLRREHGTWNEGSDVRDGNFGDHRQPALRSISTDGFVRTSAPLPGVCLVLAGPSPLEGTRIYLSCTFDGVTSVR